MSSENDGDALSYFDSWWCKVACYLDVFVMRSLLRPLRGLHSSASLWHLVGPPNPISHIRPIIYDDVPPPPPPSRLQHPYSLAEFDPAPPAGSTVHDIQWRLQRHEIDKLDESFWHDVCDFARLARPNA